MTNSNKHGLNRYIPKPIKKQIRERCGFGCVICGRVPVEYHHHNVPFAEATEHDPDDIVLLCDEHHKLVTNGLIDANDISNALRNKSGENSKTRFNLPSTKRNFFADWAGNRFYAHYQAIVIDDVTTLQFDLTKNPLEPILISGTFQDKNGNVLCKIEENEFVFRNKNCGDFSVVGNKFAFKLPDGSKSLEFELTSQYINITKIFHCHKDVYVLGDKGMLYLGNSEREAGFAGCEFKDVVTAIYAESCADQRVWQKSEIKKRTTNVVECAGLSAAQTGVWVRGKSRKAGSALIAV